MNFFFHLFVLLFNAVTWGLLVFVDRERRQDCPENTSNGTVSALLTVPIVSSAVLLLLYLLAWAEGRARGHPYVISRNAEYVLYWLIVAGFHVAAFVETVYLFVETHDCAIALGYNDKANVKWVVAAYAIVTLTLGVYSENIMDSESERARREREARIFARPVKTD